MADVKNARQRAIETASGQGTYKEMMASRESSNNYKANRSGSQFLGKYQLGTNGLKDAGYINKETGAWTGKDGVNSKEEFLNNEEAQENAMDEYTRLQEVYLKDNGAWDLIGTEFKGEIITKEGLLASSHLGGAGGINDMLKTGNVKEDGLGTKYSEYMSMGNSYAANNSDEDSPTNVAGRGVRGALVGEEEAEEEEVSSRTPWAQERVERTKAALAEETKDMSMKDKQNRIAEIKEDALEQTEGVNSIDLTGEGRSGKVMREEREAKVADKDGMINRYSEQQTDTLAQDGVTGEGEGVDIEKDYSGANALLENIGQTAPFAPAAKTGSLKGFGGIRGGDAQAKVMQGLMSRLGNKTGMRNTAVSNYRGGRPRYTSAQRPQGILSK
jgi:hypothetical protein